MTTAALPFLLLVGAATAGVAIAASDAPVDNARVPGGGDETIAIEHVTVLSMSASGETVPDATVIIANGRIQKIGPSGRIEVPRHARLVDGTDQWLLPAFSDMHVHVRNRSTAGTGNDSAMWDAGDVFMPYVANGVLQIFNLAATPEAIEQRKAIENGHILGPHMALAAMLDGSPPLRPGIARSAATPEEGRQAVRDIKAEGYDFVKTYGGLDLPTFTAILQEAGRQNLRVLGHIPERGQGITEKLLQPGFEMVAHAEEYAYQSEEYEPEPKAMADEDIAVFARLAKRNGTWLISTLSLNERIVEQTRDLQSLAARPEMRFVHPAIYRRWINDNRYAPLASPERIERLERVVDYNRKVVREFTEAGVPIVPGTDSMIPGVVPGFALHDELEALTQAGMSNEQVLVAATRLSAEWLGVSDDRGTVQAGKRADLVLLHADPLADIANTRRISAVIVNGTYLSRETLDEMMEGLALRYAAIAPVDASREEASGGHEPHP